MLDRQEKAPSAPARIEVATDVHRDSIEPAEEVAPLVVTVEMAEDAQERLLQRLFHLLGVPKDVPGERCNTAFSGHHDLFEGVTVTRPCGPDAVEKILGFVHHRGGGHRVMPS